jgi:hypothetical protein
MSHHFDTPTAREDPRINVCDFYLFRGRPGFTVMAMTVNPNAGQSGPDTFREEGLYAFRFDLDGDSREDLSFKVRFGAVSHSDDKDHAQAQSFEVRRASGPAAASGADGEPIAAGQTGRVVEDESGVKAFAGLAPDLFAGDAMALGEFRTAFFEKGMFHPQAFQNRKNFFAGKNVTAIVLEVPTSLIGKGGAGFPLGTSADHEYLHARSSNARGLQPRCPSRRHLAVLCADRGRHSQADTTRGVRHGLGRLWADAGPKALPGDSALRARHSGEFHSRQTERPRLSG